SAPLGAGGDIDRRRRESINKLRSNLISLFRVSDYISDAYGGKLRYTKKYTLINLYAAYTA
ncbi:hypothetical protein, partial [uncultured Nostoc sp.]|uniref:hypothetical protein n=1 Tax=uncultured Nostoc sp. TaxID=340711 RepID=UPI0035CA628E